MAGGSPQIFSQQVPGLEEIYPKILVQRSASQSGHLEETYPKILVQRSGSQASQVPLDEIYPHLRMQRSSSGGRLDEIYPKILVQRSASQMSQPRSVSQLSQLPGEETSLYPQMIRQRSGSAFSQLTEDVSVYPRVIASNGKLVSVPVTSSPALAKLSQHHLEEIYPKLLKQQLTSSVQLSQLPGAQLSAGLPGYEDELPVYENVYENIVVNNQKAYNNQLDYVNLPPPPPYPGTASTEPPVLPSHSYLVTAAGQHVLNGAHQLTANSHHILTGAAGHHVLNGAQHVLNGAGGQHLLTGAGGQHVLNGSVPGAVAQPVLNGAGGQHFLSGAGQHVLNGAIQGGAHHVLNGSGSQHILTGAGGQHVLTGAGGQQFLTGAGGQHLVTGSLSGSGAQPVLNGASGQHVLTGVQHVRNLSDTSGKSESSSGSILSFKSPGRPGWYETEMDSSSETLTPQLRPALLTNLPPKPGTASAGQKPSPLLPFSITPPRPPGPSKAEMKASVTWAGIVHINHSLRWRSSPSSWRRRWRRRSSSRSSSGRVTPAMRR